jgi:hypothetical protein
VWPIGEDLANHNTLHDSAHSPSRHGRVLRVDRTARPSDAARPAGRGRRRSAWARRGRGGELRSARVWRPLGDGDGARGAALSVAGDRPAAVHRISRDVRAHLRDLSQRDAAGRAALAGRSVSRRHRERLARTARHGGGEAAESRSARGDRLDGVGRRRAKQVSRQDCLRLAEAGRAHRDRAGAGRTFPATAARRRALGGWSPCAPTTRPC